MPSGNFKTESCGLCLCGCLKLEIGSWKMTEIKLVRNESRPEATQGGSGKREINLREHCWLAVKNVAN